ncbi:MAG: rRNA maturation RNase YbeY [Treponema sp.]|jgi:probable rRNA maturation factor|nr:rRNA maturation RNase YbeY [Treponema sp.]
MNRVDFSAEEVPLPGWKGRAKSFILKVLNYLGRTNWDLSVLFCGDNYIKALNAKYRLKDEATDVLSFVLGGTVEDRKGGVRCVPGDIVVSLETLEKNAAFFGVTADEELRRLLVHGILHLDGKDHKTNEPGEPMLALQETILAHLAGERIL